VLGVVRPHNGDFPLSLGLRFQVGPLNFGNLPIEIARLGLNDRPGLNQSHERRIQRGRVVAPQASRDRSHTARDVPVGILPRRLVHALALLKDGQSSNQREHEHACDHDPDKDPGGQARLR
jgi:hypothetical protein